MFTAHHSLLPTVTRVNSPSMATGVYPETHGLLGNTIYIPAVNATKGLDTGSSENLEASGRASGANCLPRRRSARCCGRRDRNLFVAGAGTSGAAFLLNHTVGNGAVVHQEFTARCAERARARNLGSGSAFGKTQRGVERARG